MISLCHQIPERSFLWLWNPPLLCARCTGFYVAALAAVMFFVLQPHRARAWTYPVIGAGLAGVVGITLEKSLGFELGNWARCLTAMPMGFAVGLGLVMPFVFRRFKEEIS
jgi:uncharacterized membrane protein